MLILTDEQIISISGGQSIETVGGGFLWRPSDDNYITTQEPTEDTEGGFLWRPNN